MDCDVFAATWREMGLGFVKVLLMLPWRHQRVAAVEPGIATKAAKGPKVQRAQYVTLDKAASMRARIGVASANWTDGASHEKMSQPNSCYANREDFSRLERGLAQEWIFLANAQSPYRTPLPCVRACALPCTRVAREAKAPIRVWQLEFVRAPYFPYESLSRGITLVLRTKF